MVVRDELTKLGLHFITIDLGVVNILEEISAQKRELFRISLLVYTEPDKKLFLCKKFLQALITFRFYYK